MPIDLTPQEISLITTLLNTANLTMNRETMAAFLNLSTSILNKFQPEIPKEGE